MPSHATAFLKSDDLLEKYNAIWDKDSVDNKK